MVAPNSSDFEGCCPLNLIRDGERVLLTAPCQCSWFPISRLFWYVDSSSFYERSSGDAELLFLWSRRKLQIRSATLMERNGLLVNDSSGEWRTTRLGALAARRAKKRDRNRKEETQQNKTETEEHFQQKKKRNCSRKKPICEGSSSGLFHRAVCLPFLRVLSFPSFLCLWSYQKLRIWMASWMWMSCSIHEEDNWT
jgi:hypothetical protein